VGSSGRGLGRGLSRGLGSGYGRVGRGLTLSVACLVVPVVAHAMAGGGIPAVGPLLFAAGLLAAACVALADRQLTVGGIASLLFASQPVFHVLLSLSAHGHGNRTSGVGMVVGHVIAAAALTVLLAGGESVLWSLAALSAVLFRRPTRIPQSPSAAPRPVRLPAHDHDAGNSYVLSINRTAPRRGPPLLTSV
jgi:hypothetical protein